MSNEREERLKQIRERHEHNKSAVNDYEGHIPKWLQSAYADIDFLLSLLDSKTAGGAICTCSDLSELERVYGEHYDNCPASTYRAATRMRKACVEKVKTMAAEVEHGDALLSAKRVIAELQSP